MAPLKDYEQYQLLDSENDESCESLPDGKASFFQDSRSILCCYWRVLTVLLSLPLCFVAGFVLGMKLGSSESSEGVSAYSKEIITGRRTRAYYVVSETFLRNAKPDLVEYRI